MTKPTIERDSSVWRIPLLPEEKAFLDQYAKDQGISLKQIFDLALAHAVVHWHRDGLPGFVLHHKDARKHGIRIDKLAFSALQTRLEGWLLSVSHSAIPATSLIATALWDYMAKSVTRQADKSAIKEIMAHQSALHIQFSAETLAS